ncbi:MAG: hypothetical protein V2A74_06455, partial [bacterium]
LNSQTGPSHVVMVADGATTGELARLVWETPVGEVAGPLSTDKGYLLLMPVEEDAATTTSFIQASTRIRGVVEQEKRGKILNQWLIQAEIFQLYRELANLDDPPTSPSAPLFSLGEKIYTRKDLDAFQRLLPEGVKPRARFARDFAEAMLFLAEARKHAREVTTLQSSRVNFLTWHMKAERLLEELFPPNAETPDAEEKTRDARIKYLEKMMDESKVEWNEEALTPHKL